jgi:hypothetical protein
MAPSLRAIRQYFRQKIAGRRMMDFAAFAHDIEAAYRGFVAGMVRKSDYIAGE